VASEVAKYVPTKELAKVVMNQTVMVVRGWSGEIMDGFFG
jgi:hypothetical protein